eukprot:GHVT01050899.1.p2 GENE.GHVT01050899.1~~GHVT01050899.1.p2  ORF type:complete len:136 (-),score=17.08 GHVT01050899.1:513-920(-)
MLVIRMLRQPARLPFVPTNSFYYPPSFLLVHRVAIFTPLPSANSLFHKPWLAPILPLPPYGFAPFPDTPPLSNLGLQTSTATGGAALRPSLHDESNNNHNSAIQSSSTTWSSRRSILTLNLSLKRLVVTDDFSLQ